MIPKRIYFTWISEKPIPEKYNKYIESWKRIMPDYEIVQITLDNVKRGTFVNKSIEIKNFALAGHYARVQELYDNGGIYFDIDIEAVRPMDTFLKSSLVLGAESDLYINNAVIVAKKGHPFLKACMEFMDNTPFDTDKIELSTGPIMFTNLMKNRGWRKGLTGKFGDIDIMAPRYFYPYHYDEFYTPACITEHTYCIHHWSNSWNDKVSIVIPCYKQAHWLPDAIKSALAQTYKNIEVIVVNDGSPDDTSKVAKQFNVKLIVQENKGLSAARNAGIKKSAGGWILCLDADDKIQPDFVEKTIGKSDIVSTYIKTFGAEERIWKPQITNPTHKDLLEQNHLHCCSLFKKDVWTLTGGFDEAMRDGYEDWDFWTRATQLGFYATVVEEPLFNYRKHGASMLTHARKNHDSIRQYMLSKYKTVEPVDIVIPLGKGSAWDDNELRYALRSIERHVFNFRNIIIVGERPQWLTNVIHIPFKEGAVPSDNIKNKILAACDYQGISKEFMVTNDDIFFTFSTDAARYKHYCNSTIDFHIKNNSTGWYKTFLMNTQNALEKANKAQNYFDIHHPIVYNKHLFKEVMKRYYNTSMVVKSIYCNALNITGVQASDTKIKHYMKPEQVEEFVKGRTVFSIGDYCLIEMGKEPNPIKSYLNKLFPIKSKYEL